MLGEEIEALIEQGYDIGLISLELNIPIEELEECKLNMEKQKNNNTTKVVDRQTNDEQPQDKTSTDSIDINANYRKKRGHLNQLLKCIEEEVDRTNDIEGLEKLIRNLEKIGDISEDMYAGRVYRKIFDKIQRIKIEQYKKEIKNNISESIKLIIKGIESGNIDIQQARETINQEAKKRVESKPKNRFSLNEEQERKQILFQIKNAIEENVTESPIQNFKKTINIIQELCEESLGISIRIVVGKLIKEKKFNVATGICGDYLKESTDSKLTKQINWIQQNIKIAEDIAKKEQEASASNKPPKEKRDIR